MKYTKQVLLFFIFSITLSLSVHADNLGRIFTSAEERQKLEKVRHLKEIPKKIEVVEVEQIIEPVIEVQKEIIIRDPITLKGIVHRSDGKNTAWVNDSNTLEGDLNSESIQVSNSEIKPDQVRVVMPEDGSHVELKVGEIYTPKPIEIEIVNSVGE